MGTCLVIKNNLKRSLNNRTLFVLLFILPIILTVLMGFVNQISSNSIRIGILSDDNPTIAEKLTELLRPSESMQYEQANVDSIHTDLIMGKYQFIIDFRGIKELTDFELITYYNLDEESIKDTLMTALRTNIAFVIQNENKGGITFAERMNAFLLTLLLITSTLNASGLIRDRKGGTLTRFCYSPQDISNYIRGNILYTMLLAALQITFSFLFLRLLRIPFHLSMEGTIAIGILIVGISSAFGTFITVLCKSDMKANVTASCIAILWSMLGGTFIPYEQMPSIIKVISIFSPVRWIIDITQSLEQGVLPINHAAPYLIIVGFMIFLYISSLVSIRIKR